MRFVSSIRAVGLLLCLTFSVATLPSLAQSATPQPEAILHSADMVKLIPGSVFFRGQTATTQIRNAGGVRFADGRYALASLVDNSGYSTGIQEKYQAYLITEVPLSFGGHTLAPGAYGAGIVRSADSLQFVVQDLGAHDLIQTAAANDAKLHRPTPLQVVAGSAPGKYRLYFGRNYVEFERTQ
ncbi:hypothetical protein HNQ77_001462 [Silvibacterium bohemicum]|uniref:DUF3455 domain-containing protein n=1 Tax=Silvibacterium bohemicum TaxID=1577686 RepID=A0A841JYK6_9BACT|nr:hypothetical protein [Silvibacterium bohemicum]MBB6143518.1 hypothetical protein [Silvibacterium bohemicum]